MKILMIDKYHFIKGGAERYLFELKNILEAHGHQVITFSMQHEDNFPSEWSDYFVKNIEFNSLSLWQKLRQAPRITSRVIYSFEARNALERLLQAVRPDVAHLHMIDHQLSPSILHPLKEHSIPVIQTCHQYKLVCPSYRLFVMHKNEICERCKGRAFYHAVLQRCHKGSLLASSLVALESYIHRFMKIYDLIDLFHVPSRFLGEKLKEAGIAEERIWHHFYTIDLKQYPFSERMEDYFIYYGRLSAEKGILSLLKAMQQCPEAKLRIIGGGPQEAELREFCRRHGLRNVELVGPLFGEELIRAVQNSRFVVVPSEWHDNSPLVIYESFSMGKPVVGTRLGGVPELIEEGKTGFLFDAGDVEALASIIRRLWDSPELCRELGRNARKKAEREFAPEHHYEKMMERYRRLLAVSSSPAHADATV